MKHHHEEEATSYDYMYYLIGLVAGLFTGFVLDIGFIWIPILGLVGLLFAAFFVNTLVKGRGDA